MKALRNTVLAAATALTVGGVAAWAQAPAPAPAAGQRIGFVDLRRVVVRSAAGVAAREQLERERAGMQKEMDGKRQELEKLRDELEKKGTLLTADARREKQDQLERKRRDAARLADDLTRELEKKERAMLQKVLQELGPIIERYGKERGFHMILERGAGVVYASAEVDLTDDIIRSYDQQAAKGKK
jgi:outer membrane protein